MYDFLAQIHMKLLLNAHNLDFNFDFKKSHMLFFTPRFLI